MTNAFYLYNDALSALLGPLSPGAGSSIQNSQCQINGATSAVSGNGNTLTVTMTMSLLGTYATTAKNVYLWAKDFAGNDTGWVQTGTWNPAGSAPQPPVIVSVTPSLVVAVPQTFRITVRDPNGANDLARLYWQIGQSSTITTNGCHGFYDRVTNALYVYSNTLTGLFGPAGVGQQQAAGNSQCIAIGSTSRVVANSGNDFVLDLTLSIQGNYADNPQNVYFWAKDSTNNDTGWIFLAQWNTSNPPQPPSIVSGTPATATGSPQTLNVVARDPNGYYNIYRLYFLVNSNSSIPQNSCHGFYDVPTNAFYLYNDALNGISGPLTPGSGGTIQNSQCRVNAASSTVSGSNTDLTMGLNMTLLGAYDTTTQNVYFWAKDLTNNDTGWVKTTTWNPNNPTMPSVVSGTPSNPTGSPQLMTFVGRDPQGFGDIYRLYFLINANATIPVNTCHGFYDRISGAVYLYNDALTGLLGPLTPGAASSIQNSQCKIEGTGSQVSGAGNDLTVRLSMSLQGSYAGTTKNVYLWVKDNANNDTGWVQTGTWTQPQ
jgi:hypothetical protein